MHKGRRTWLRTANNGLQWPLSAALLVTVAFVIMSCLIPLTYAIPFRLRGGTISKTITLGRAVDSVLLDGVVITNGTSMVFDVAAMLPGTLRIDLKDCVCDRGSQIYVRGYNGKSMSEQKLLMNVIGLTGDFCSLVFVHNLPENTKVIIRDSTIVTPAPINYSVSLELTDMGASPLVLYATLLSHSQLCVSNTVLRNFVASGVATYFGGGVQLVSSAVVFDGVLLEALSDTKTYVMYVPPSSTLTLQNFSVLSVTNTSVASSGGGFALGNRLILSDSVLRFVSVDGRVKVPLVTANGGTIGAGGWLDLRRVRVVGAESSVASLSSVTLGSGGSVSITRCAVTGKELVSSPVVKGGVVSVQCNRASGSILRSVDDYHAAGLPSVRVVSCDDFAEVLNCFSVLTSSFSRLACICRAGGVGKACLPFDLPLAKIGGEGVKNCVRGVRLTESTTVGSGQATVCFDAVVFSGPITVTIDLSSMDAFADMLNVTLRHCLLESGAQLRIEGVDEATAQSMPRVHVSMMNMTATEGTILLRGTLPVRSKVLLVESTLQSTINGSHYTLVTASGEKKRHGPVLVLDGVQLRSAQLVVTRTTLMCGGGPCAAILVEHDLVLDQASSFYMDGCAVNSGRHVMSFIASNLTVGGGSVFSIQRSSWRVKTQQALSEAWKCDKVTVTEGSVLQMAENKFGPSKSVISMDALVVDNHSWLVHRDNEFRVLYVFEVSTVRFNNQSVWSVLRNNFLKVSGSVSAASMWTFFGLFEKKDVTVHGMCNYLLGEPLKYYRQISMPMDVTMHNCDVCARNAQCFPAKSGNLSLEKCGCECVAGSHGDACLPAPIPMELGPPPPLAAVPAKVPCIYGGTVNEVEGPAPGISGLCFVDVHFISPLIIDLGDFRPTSQVINITLMRCALSGLQVIGNSEYAVQMSMVASTVEDGNVVLDGTFGPGSQIQVVDSTVDTTGPTGLTLGADFGVGCMVLLLRTVVIATRKVITFKDNLVLNASGVVVQGCRLEATLPLPGESTAALLKELKIFNGGYLSIVDTQMVAERGITLSYGGTLASFGTLVLIRNTLTSHKGNSGSALLFNSGPLTVSGGSKLRVMSNKIKDAFLYYAPRFSLAGLSLSGETTAAVFSDNTVNGTADVFVMDRPNVMSSAKLFVGCNKKNGVLEAYNAVFKENVTQINCDTCDSDAVCHMPGVKSVVGGLCFCRPNVSGDCQPCLPVSVPAIAVMPRLEKPVDMNTSCVVGRTLTSISLNMWKTHHCYVGVTFKGAGASARFLLRRMPLHLPVNITFSGCTFLDGAALHFAGSRDAVESAGVLIRVFKTMMHSSTVSLSNAFPRGSDIVVTDVDAEQSSIVITPKRFSNRFAVVTLEDVLLAASSSLLVSNVNARRRSVNGPSAFSGSGVHVDGSLTLLDGSSLYVRHCTLAGYAAGLCLDGKVRISNRSVLALLSNSILTGASILENREVVVEDSSVFRVTGNTGDVKYGIYMYGYWSVRQLSWLDWRDNDVNKGAMFYIGFTSGVNMDSTSVLTLTGCKMGSFWHPWTRQNSLLLHNITNHRFVAGCLTIAGELVTTEEKLKLNSITGVTKVAECGTCAKESDCFDALTASIQGCACRCDTGGHGDVCAPARLVHLPPNPPLPSPPALGDCISNMEYPEVTQTVGGGLSSLCYRNVTFSGAFMRLTVSFGAMIGDVVNVVFDGCRWQRGAVLVLEGAVSGTMGLLNINITANTFEDAVLSIVGAFPPRTNIIINGNSFNVTRVITVPGVIFGHASCVVMGELMLSQHSALMFVGNRFHTAGPHSVAVYVVSGGVAVLEHSVFAMTGNKFTVTDSGSAALYMLGGGSAEALRVQDNSVVSIEWNVVSGTLADFVCLSSLKVTNRSALLLERNVGLVKNVFYTENNAELGDSWVLIHKNAAYGTASVVYRIGSKVKMRKSRLVLSENSVSPVSEKQKATVLFFNPHSVHEVDAESSLVLACNRPTESDQNISSEIQGVFKIIVQDCDESCASTTSCFPGYTTKASGMDCACECAEGGHGGRCLPVDVLSSHGADPCIRDMNVTWDVHGGTGDLVICYVGVTFTRDVVVDVRAMSGSARNVTLINCTMVNGASLYVMGWPSDPPTGLRLDVWISGLVSRSGGGVLIANTYPSGSSVTVVDSMLVARSAVVYRGEYGLGGTSACFVLYNVKLMGSVLTIARTQVVSLFDGGVGLLSVGGVALLSRAALYVDRLLAQTVVGACVSVDGEVAADDGSVLSFSDSDFLLCKNAVFVRGALNVSGSVVKFLRSTFASTQGYAVEFGSTVSLTNGSMLLMKGNVHDGVVKEMLHVVGSLTVAGSTLSFVRNEVAFAQMLLVDMLLGAGAHVRVACNRVGGRILTTVDEYAAVGFGESESIKVVGCDTCDKNTHCYTFGTASVSEQEGECVCACDRGRGHGETCIPVRIAALPPVTGATASEFEMENTVVRSAFIVPNGVSEVTLRHVVLDGVQPVIYLPWMAEDGVRIVVQNVSLRNGAVLYVMGGTGMRRAGSSAEVRQVEVSMCGVEALNGVIVLSGTFPADSVVTISESLLITTEPTSLLYFPSLRSEVYAPALVLSNLRLLRTALLLRNVELLAVTADGRTVVAEGAVMELNGSGVALDAVSFGGEYAVYVDERVVLSGGAVLRVSESTMYAGRGLLFAKGVLSNASAVIATSNTGMLSAGTFLDIQGSVLFVSGSWLSVRGNNFGGGRGLLSLPPDSSETEFLQSTLTLYGNTGGGSSVVNGSVVLRGHGGNYVVGCVRHNGEELAAAEYGSVGIVGHTRTVACDTCDADVNCFAPATKAMSSCSCRCAQGGYGIDCLPVNLPHVNWCNRTLECPALGLSVLSDGDPTLDGIRRGSALSVRLAATLPPPFRWAHGEDLRPYVNFAPVSDAHPNDFRGQERAMLRNVTWEHGVANPERVLELTVPVHAEDFTGVGEIVSILYSPRALHGSCIGTLQGDVTINKTVNVSATPSTPRKLLKTISAVSGVSAGVAVVAAAAMGGFGSILEMQALGVFSRMTCASALGRMSFVGLPYIVSPFANFGALWMVVGNALVLAVFGCVHYSLTVVYRRCRGVDTKTAWAAMQFPSLTYVVAYLMHLGIFVYSVSLLLMPDARTQHYVIGATGLLYGVVFVPSVYYFITHQIDVSFIEYAGFSKRSVCMRWLYPVGYWGPPEQRRMYGSIFVNVRGNYIYGCLFQLSVLCLVGVISALHPPLERCYILYFCAAAVLIVGAGVLAVTNMMRSTFLTVMHAVSFVLLAALCLISAAHYLLQNDDGMKAHAAITMMALFVLLAIGVYSILMCCMERRGFGVLYGPQKPSATDDKDDVVTNVLSPAYTAMFRSRSVL